MRLLKPLCRMVVTVFISLLKLCWSSLLFLIDMIDGGEKPERMPLGRVWYNYRTGEIDPVKRFDGIYDNHYGQDIYNDN